MHRATENQGPQNEWIGIAAPSWKIDVALLQKGLRRFASWGYPVRLDDIYYAGADEDRAAALVALLRDPAVRTIWCARGGSGATRLLGLLDRLGAPALLRKERNKLLVGYSDVTALHFYFQRLGLATLHAPMPATKSWQRLAPRVDRLLAQALAGELPIGRESYTAKWKTKPIYMPRKAVEGVIRGGNLTLVANLAGTRWQPDLNGAFLFLEDCGERPYEVDRMLTHLGNAGMLRGLRAVLLGDFEADVIYREPGEKKYWKEIFLDHFAAAGVPVITGLPVGHDRKQNDPLPLGVQAALDSRGKLFLLEQVVKR